MFLSEGSVLQIKSHCVTFCLASTRRALRSLAFSLLYLIETCLILVYLIRSHRTRLSLMSLNSLSQSGYFEVIRWI